MSALHEKIDTSVITSKVKVVDVTDEPISDQELVSIYRWLDTLEFSRPKKTSAHRDFADGVMMAELVAHYIPKIVNTRQYIPASATLSKLENWQHLNSRVFRRIRFQMTPKLLKEVADARPGMIERVLKPLRLILLRGPKAVAPSSNKLDSVKSRFMDIDRSYLKQHSAQPADQVSPPPTPIKGKISSPTSVSSKSKSPRPENHPPTLDINANLIEGGSQKPTNKSSKPRKTNNKPSTAPEAHFSEQEPCERVVNHLPPFENKQSVLGGNRNADASRSSTGRTYSISPASRSSTPRAYSVSPASRSSTPRAYSVSPVSRHHYRPQSAISRLHGADNAVIELPSPPLQPKRKSRQTTRHIIPPCSSWLPVVGEVDQGSVADEELQMEDDPFPAINDHSPGPTRNNTADECATDLDDDEVADDEIYCSGYEDDDEDDDRHYDGTYIEQHDRPQEHQGAGAVTDGPHGTKRTVKRVLKYEYREEYILNGMASYQLPNEGDFETVQRDYMSPGNKDPRCRGYGFV